MKHIVLCGGSGTRLSTATGFPKPLNLVFGAHSIQRVIESIPSSDVQVFMNRELQSVSFDTTLPHLVRKKIHIIMIDRPTRGAIETAYLGLQKAQFPDDTPICFYDNDTVYSVTEVPATTFIGTTHLSSSESRPYSFLSIENSRVVEIAEKVRISDDQACGVYGFESTRQFLSTACDILRDDIRFNNEFQMSLIYSRLISQGIQVRAVSMTGVCTGTPEDIRENHDRIPFVPLRVCFDLDNTVFKYRREGQGYADCEPIESVVFYLRELKKLGHTIILQTARGMKTHQNDVGRVMRHIAEDTFKSLSIHSIPQDEIYFGKPVADLQIDDRAFNPQIDLQGSTGFGYLTEAFARSKIPASSSNRFNLVYRVGSDIIKQGPTDSMRGEVFFQNTVRHTPIASLFPGFVSANVMEERTEMRLRFVEGFTLYELLRDGLLTDKHIRTLLDSLDSMHNQTGIPIQVTSEQLYANYMGKLWKRIQNTTDYPFEDVSSIVQIIDLGVRESLTRPKFAAVVHGDPWFSNTLMTPKGGIVFLDMKGDIAGTLTTNGDALTDFGKIQQSLLGFDFILEGKEVPNFLQELEAVFLTEADRRGFLRRDLRLVTACLIAKTLSFLTVELPVRTSIWNIVRSLVQ